MTLIKNITNSAPFFSLNAMATKIAVTSLPEIPLVITPDIQFCELEKPYNECVFGSNTTDWWKNDLTRFTFKRFVSSDSIAMELFKDGISVTLLNNNTYGTFTNGFFNGNSVEQQLYVSMLLDWKLVILAFGNGSYQIKSTNTIIGVATLFESVNYNLQFYSEKAANKTVRLEIIQNGTVNGNLIDHDGLELYSSFRIKGDFIENVEELIIKKYKTTFSEWRQIQDKVIENYELRTKMLPRVVTANLTKNISLSNSIKITDYKILAEALYRRIEVYPVDFEKTQLENNKNSIYNIKFTARKENNIKRNF